VADRVVLSPALRRAFDRLAQDVTRVFGDRLEAVAAYDGHRSVVFAASVTPADLAALAPLVHVWHREGLQTPLVMTFDEFRRSLDAFPLEYQAIAERHLIVAGRDPFAGVQVADADVRRACEVQAKAHVIHLRQGWLEAGGDTAALAELIHESAEPWRVLLANVARLRDAPPDDRAALASWASTVTGMPADLAVSLIAVEDGGQAAAARLVARLPEYVQGAERLWAAIDAWKA
jgi:hypothetical protein